jgi:hypothetical protein
VAPATKGALAKAGAKLKAGAKEKVGNIVETYKDPELRKDANRRAVQELVESDQGPPITITPSPVVPGENLGSLYAERSKLRQR